MVVRPFGGIREEGVFVTSGGRRGCVEVVAELTGERYGGSRGRVEVYKDEALSCDVCVNFEKRMFRRIEARQVHVLTRSVEGAGREIRPVGISPPSTVSKHDMILTTRGICKLELL